MARTGGLPASIDALQQLVAEQQEKLEALQSTVDEQAERLSQVFSGQLGGPMAGLAPLITDFVGVERLPVSVENNGKDHHIVVGNALDLQLSKEITGDGDPVQLTNIVIHPAGPTLDVAIANNVSNSVFGIDWSGDGLSGFANPYSWAA